MNRIFASCLPVAGLAVACLLAGCSTTSTSMLSAWADPAAKEKIKAGGKVLAVYPIKEPTMRQKVEDRIVKWVKDSEPSYPFVSEGALGDPERAREAISQRQYDFVLVLNIADFKQEARQDAHVDWHDAQPVYDYYWGYTAYAFDVGAYYSRGFTELNTTIVLETLIFDATTGKKIFAGRTQIKEPGTAEMIIDQIFVAVRQTLLAAGLR